MTGTFLLVFYGVSSDISRCKSVSLLFLFSYYSMATELDTVAVDSASVRRQLKAKKINTQMVAAFTGYADKSTINSQLRAGAVTKQVAAFLERVGVTY